MNVLPRWIATVLATGVFLSLSFCGAMMSSPASVVVAHEMVSVESVQCAGVTCSPSEAPCSVQCLQRLGRSQQRVIVEGVALAAVLTVAFGFVARVCFDAFAPASLISLWRGHRLFAFRE